MATNLTVTSTELVPPCLRRLWFRSDDLSAFADSVCTDRYVKLVFPKEGVTYPEPLDMRALRGALLPEDMPSVRTFTALFPNVERGTLAIDFVIHGDGGIAGPWAAAAVPGDRLTVNGPGARIGPTRPRTGTCSWGTRPRCRRSRRRWPTSPRTPWSGSWRWSTPRRTSHG